VDNSITSNGIVSIGSKHPGITIWNFEGQLPYSQTSPFWCSMNITITGTTIENNGTYGIYTYWNEDGANYTDGPIKTPSITNNTISGNNGGGSNPQTSYNNGNQSVSCPAS
jgi:hypothetical protein